MSHLATQPIDPHSMARKFQAKLLLDIPKQKQSLVDMTWRIRHSEGEQPNASPRKPCHDLSTAHVIALIEKRLKWINRLDLQVGLMKFSEDNCYMIELVGADHTPVYQVFVDAAIAQFYWVEV